MGKIVWSDRLAVDRGVIDGDHRLLIDIVNMFLERAGHFSSSDEAMEILERLDTYAQVHFPREEELQRISRFPERQQHFIEHNRLRKRLNKLMIETRPTSGPYVNVMGEQIGDFIHDWLFKHIMVSDIKMRPYAERMKASAQEMAPLSIEDLASNRG